jgi:hypothetical protein
MERVGFNKSLHVGRPPRSEEHTSELQSHTVMADAVLWVCFCGCRAFFVFLCLFFFFFSLSPPPPPPPRPPLLAKSRLNRGAKTQNILFCENSPQAQNSRAFQGGWPAGVSGANRLIRSGAGGALRNMICLGIQATFSGGSLSRVAAYS